MLELYSEFDQKLNDVFVEYNCDHLLLTKSYDEFYESLQFEPVDIACISSPSSKKVLLKKAVEICKESELPIIVISDDDIKLEELAVVSKSNFREHFKNLMDDLGYLGTMDSENIPSNSIEDNLITDSIFIKSNQQYIRILFKDILFVKSEHVYLEIYTLKDRYLARATFKEYEEKLPSDSFYRAHKSYVVNINHIDMINQAYVVINQTHIPISREFKSFITKSIKI